MDGSRSLCVLGYPSPLYAPCRVDIPVGFHAFGWSAFPIGVLRARRRDSFKLKVNPFHSLLASEYWILKAYCTNRCSQQFVTWLCRLSTAQNRCHDEIIQNNNLTLKFLEAQQILDETHIWLITLLIIVGNTVGKLPLGFQCMILMSLGEPSGITALTGLLNSRIYCCLKGNVRSTQGPILLKADLRW